MFNIKGISCRYLGHCFNDFCYLLNKIKTKFIVFLFEGTDNMIYQCVVYPII